MIINKLILAGMMDELHLGGEIKNIVKKIGYGKQYSKKDNFISFLSREPVIIVSSDSSFFYATLENITDKLSIENIKFAAKGEMVISESNIFIIAKTIEDSSIDFFFKENLDFIKKEQFNCFVCDDLRKFVNEFDDYYLGYDKRYAEVYSKGGTTWEAITPNLSLLKVYQNYPNYFSGKKVIDLGCGEGRDTIFLSQKNIDVIGVDISMSALQKAKKLSKNINVKAKFVEANVLFLNGMPDGYFDTAINMGCLHMIVTQKERLSHIRNVYRILKKGGVFIVDHCQENWGRGFFSLSGNLYNKENIKPGNFIARKIRTTEGEKIIPLEVIPFIEKKAKELSLEIESVGFNLKDALLTDTESFGNSALLVFKKSG